YSPPIYISTSFPTRRSSDLIRITVVSFRSIFIVVTYDMAGVIFFVQVIFYLCTKILYCLVKLFVEFLERIFGDSPFHYGYRSLQDRKSTRLNSSHVKISYAV